MGAKACQGAHRSGAPSDAGLNHPPNPCNPCIQHTAVNGLVRLILPPRSHLHNAAAQTAERRPPRSADAFAAPGLPRPAAQTNGAVRTGIHSAHGVGCAEAAAGHLAHDVCVAPRESGDGAQPTSCVPLCPCPRCTIPAPACRAFHSSSCGHVAWPCDMLVARGHVACSYVGRWWHTVAWVLVRRMLVARGHVACSYVGRPSHSTCISPPPHSSLLSLPAGRAGAGGGTKPRTREGCDARKLRGPARPPAPLAAAAAASDHRRPGSLQIAASFRAVTVRVECALAVQVL